MACLIAIVECVWRVAALLRQYYFLASLIDVAEDHLLLRTER